MILFLGALCAAAAQETAPFGSAGAHCGSRTPPPRTVLVTGAARGIGAAIAAEFAANGDRVVLACRSDLAAAEAVRASLPPSAAGEHLCLQADLAAPGAPAALVDAAIEACGGRLDVLIVNHGVYVETPFGESSAAEFGESFERLLRINLAAPAELSFAFATAAKRSGHGGAVVLVSSRGATRGEPLAPAYGASKAGLNSLTGSLAQAYAPHGIRVAAVAPGFIATDMAKEVLASDRGDGIRAQSPFGRVGEPAEVAAAVHFLASEAGAWSAGAVLDCNGASYLH